MKYYNDKKRKFNIIGTAVTALLLAAAVLINITVYVLADKFRWYIDMTKGQVYSLCDASKEILSDVKDEVNIYFAVEADKVYEASPNLYYVYQTAREMEADFDNIHVKCVDIIKNPAFFKGYHTTAAQDIYTTSVIVESGTEFRLYTVDSFFVTNEDGKIWAYEGEYKLVTAVLTVTAAEMPVVAFTASHGEKTGDKAKALVSLFSDGGFEVVDVDLSREELPEDVRIVVVNDPVYDFTGIEGGDADEIKKLDAFMDTFGTLMVFSSPENAGNLTNLSEFLSEWGIAFTPDTYIKDTSHSLSVDGKKVLADYTSDSMGASLYLDIANMENAPKTVMGNVMPLKVLYEEDDQLDGSKQTSPVLTAYDTAKAVSAEGETDAGGVPLLTVTRETKLIDNEYYYSYVLVGGSADFLSDSYINSTSFANRDIVYNTMKTTGIKRIPADIEPKVLDDTEMTVSTAQANRWTVALTVCMPAVFALAGVVVYIRRKNL
ncbi:MAG: Gldg family protein [Clostridia bacterium]|nr:Gldg family protein [Clostridia bacterium]